MIFRITLTLLLLCGSPLSFAGIYTYLDEHGERVFTDKPPQGQSVERVKIAPTNQLPAVPVVKALKAPPMPQEQAANLAPAYQVLRILTPEPDATVRANDRQMIVTVSSEPALAQDHLFRIILDGKPAAEPSRSPVFPLHNIDRGTHQLAVEIIDQQGKIMERTPAQPFHLRQTTLSDKRRVRPCTDDDYGLRPECPLQDQPEKNPNCCLFITLASDHQPTR